LHRSSSQSRRFSRNRMTIQAQEIIRIDPLLKTWEIALPTP